MWVCVCVCVYNSYYEYTKYRLIKKEREKQREREKLKKRQNSVPNEQSILKNALKWQNIRIIQKELVYVIGLSPSLASDEVSL